MKTYKRIIASIFALTLTVGVLTGCGDTAGEKSTDDTTTTAAQTEDTTTTAALEETTTSVTTTVTEKETPESEADTETITEVPESSANVGIETMADNPEGKYTLMECFRRKAEEYSGQKVVSIGYNDENMVYEVTLSDGKKAFLTAPMNVLDEPDNLYSIDLFEILEMEVNEYSFVVSM
ncbi:hypothetical protein [uncultured Ruminococcus sp.]|uniref:hypothetical protein n=1 Tax=uncultured Ruminococcus sp. TaxID=165186 RepID=UPI0025CC5AE1|nr:hypothetical protein [uncultured Ruminococcus sp.]